MIEATRDSLYITEANTPMIYLRYMRKTVTAFQFRFRAEAERCKRRASGRVRHSRRVP